jgi:hypothetical protein
MIIKYRITYNQEVFVPYQDFNARRKHGKLFQKLT